MVDAIQVRNVTKRFGPVTAVDDLSFDVRRGEIVGFLGPNGSGKTTTMRLLTSYYTPDNGTILIEGEDNQDRDMETRRSIGYLPENNPLYADLLVVDYMKFVADMRGMTKKQFDRNIAQVVEETGISDVYYRPIGQCSKGYKQRTGLAAALLHLPHILIMDEPTEGLDPNQRATIRDLIKGLGGDRTVLLSTHVLSEVQTTCQRLMMINKGQIVAQGTADEIQSQARGQSHIALEIEGEGVEEGLLELPDLKGLERQKSVDGRQKFTMAVSENRDLRPRIFRLAKNRNWIIWELHEEAVRLDDLFYSLTGDMRNDSELKDAEDSELDEED